MEKGEKQGLQPLTFFEILFLMGMIIFSQKEIDYCILETGLGGRLDATVLSDPVLSIITSISYDHMEILGDTIEKIAAEKNVSMHVTEDLIDLIWEDRPALSKRGISCYRKNCERKKIPSLRAEIARPYNFKKIRE